MEYDEIIKRVGYFRTRANLSQRELSQRLGYNPQFIKTIESKTVELKAKTLLDICEVCGITIFDFFYLGTEYNKDDKNMLDMFNRLSAEGKQTIINLMQQLK